MSIWYRRLHVLQEPFDLGLDRIERVQIAFNVQAEKQVSDQFLQELIQILEDAGVGVQNTTLFAGSGAVLPATREAPAFIQIRSTGGASPEFIQQGAAYHQPSAQVVAVHALYLEAEALAFRARDAFLPVRNVGITVTT